MSPLSSSMSECTLQRYWSPFPNLPYSRSLISVVLNMITYHNLLVESSLQRCLGYFLFIISVTRIIHWTFLSSLKFDVFSSVQFSCSVVSDSLWPRVLQHARPPCPSPTPGVYSNSCPSSLWCHPAISSSVVPFSSCPQSLPASESFPMSQIFTWGD